MSKQWTENSNPIPNSCIPSRSLLSPDSCLGVSTRKLILHDYLSKTKQGNDCTMSSLTSMVQLELPLFATAESVQSSNEMTLRDKSALCADSIQRQKSSKTSVVGLTSKEKDLEPYGTCALIMYLLGERSSPLHCGQNPLLSGRLEPAPSARRGLLDGLLWGNKLTIVMSTLDRLCRFRFELIQCMVEQNGGTILVLDQTVHSPESELT